jgi:hypothetical protein
VLRSVDLRRHLRILDHVIPRTVPGLLFAFLLLLVSSTAAAQRPGTLVIEGDYEGAEVFVDAEQVGTLPMDPLELDPGNHTIRVSRGGFTEFTDVFRIRPRMETVVVVEMMAISMALTVTTAPEGVQVFVDGEYAGETPLELELDEGEHSIRLKKFGYHDMVQQVQAVAGQDDSLELALEALPQEELEALTTPPPTPWYGKPWVWAVIGGGVVAAALVAVIVFVATRPQDTRVQEFCAMDPDGPERCIRVDLGM